MQTTEVLNTPDPRYPDLETVQKLALTDFSTVMLNVLRGLLAEGKLQNEAGRILPLEK